MDQWYQLHRNTRHLNFHASLVPIKSTTMQLLEIPIIYHVTDVPCNSLFPNADLEKTFEKKWKGSRKKRSEELEKTI